MAATPLKNLIRFKKTVRTEPSAAVSEFNLVTSEQQKVDVGQLVGALGKNVKNVGELKKQLTTATKRSSTLDTPLHKSAKEQVERRVLYDEAKKRVGFWDEAVRQNRLADKLEFPLHKPPPTGGTLEQVVQRFTPRTTLELESAKILAESKSNLTSRCEYSQAELESLKAMSLEEAEKRKAKLAKMRALVTFQAAKNRRKNLIKSKRYHRLEKKQKRKETEKEFVDLLRVDPTAAQEKLDLLERDRVKERGTLKHRSTGKWAKQIRQFAKKDPQLREALQQQLRLGRELAEKLAEPEKSDDDVEDDKETELPEKVSGQKIKPTLVNLTPKIADFALPGQSDELSGDDDQMRLISEAFADDDVVEAEIEEEMKQGDEKIDKLQNSGPLPGWNSWTGPGVKEWRKKPEENTKVEKKQLIKKRPAVVINEKANDSIKKYQVKQIPFPFCKPEVFEANLSHPLGKEWNPETAFKVLVEPSVRTRMGKIIEPIDKSYVFKKRKMEERKNRQLNMK